MDVGAIVIENGQVIELEIEGLTATGEGIGTYQGLKVFVDGALKDERVLCKIRLIKSNYAIATLIKILVNSSERVEPVCPLFGLCGGCQIMQLNYAAQLNVKKKKVLDAFERIGKSKIEEDLEVVPSPLENNYRNKVQLPAAKDLFPLQLGLFSKNSHNVIPLEKCYIHSSLGQSVFEKIATLFKSSDILPFDESYKTGELRHVLLRSSYYTKEVLVVLITAQPLSKKIEKMSEQIAQIPFVKGVVHHRNAREGNAVFDKDFTLLQGQPFINEKILGLDFQISGASFFQVNTLQAENLYQYALDLADLDENMHVLDAYCGIGTLSLQIAKRVKKVTGVECVDQAIQDAKLNALNNQVNNVEFLCSTTEKVVSQFNNLNVVFLNPPRKGCDKHVLEVLGSRKVKKIIYISCDPATLARDVKILEEMGYKKSGVKAFDMFPQTMHVETVVCLSLI